MRSLICTHIENVCHSRMYQSWSPVLGPANDKGDVDRSTVVPFVFRLRWLLRLCDSLQTYRVNSWLYKHIFTVKNCLNAGTVDPRHNVMPRDQQIFLVISGYRWTSRRGNSSVFINSATRLMTEMLRAVTCVIHFLIATIMTVFRLGSGPVVKHTPTPQIERTKAAGERRHWFF